MSLTLSALLIPFWIFLGVFFVFAFFDIWHMLRYGARDIRNFIALFVFLAGSTVILWAAAQHLALVDWSLPLINLPKIGTMPTDGGPMF
ncbi:MAG: hypothetical protein ABIG71_02975 [Candidatus Uhrbacteria bacterium]